MIPSLPKSWNKTGYKLKLRQWAHYDLIHYNAGWSHLFGLSFTHFPSKKIPSLISTPLNSTAAWPYVPVQCLCDQPFIYDRKIKLDFPHWMLINKSVTKLDHPPTSFHSVYSWFLALRKTGTAWRGKFSGSFEAPDVLDKSNSFQVKCLLAGVHNFVDDSNG